ncbi:MAG: 50S ribosomal protein L3 [Chloroflexi bacterium]|nr:50S ribosomal protein L3 [Chloroflexota bacterium]
MVHGLIGRKLGMTQVFRPDGTVVPVTVIEAGPCTITQIRTRERDGYEAVQLGFGRARRLNKPERGHLKQLSPHPVLREVSAGSLEGLAVGQSVDASVFAEGERVDVVGVSKGKGFAGVVKRHHFRGGPKTHGQSDRWRAPGSTGAGTTPGRVLKGTRMAGHMGHERVTMKNLEVVRVDPERNVLLVRGAVPGARSQVVVIRRARGH